MRPHLLPAVLALCLLPPAVSAQALHTVHTDGSADFRSIDAAVSAAVPGDVVLVLGGFHETVVVDRGIALVNAGGAAITKASTGPGADQPALTVTGVPAGQTAVISGFTVFVGEGGADAALAIRDTTGAVWLQDLFVDSYGAAALFVEDAASVALTSTRLQTNLIPALPDGTPQPAPGARFAGATRAFGHDVDVTGSHGTLQGTGDPVPTAPPDGGPGLVAEDAYVSLTGGSVSGGSGNSFFDGACSFAGDGGDGVVTADGAAPGLPQVVLRDVAVSAGFGGFFDPSCAPPPAMGQVLDVLPGTLATPPGAERLFALPGHASAGATVGLYFDGQEGDAAFLLVATAAAPGSVVGSLDLHLDLDTLVLAPVFPLPSGELDLPVLLPPLPAGLEALVVPMQAVFVDDRGAKHAAGPRALIIH